MGQVTFQDYGYTNARVRALRQTLLDKEFYEKLISMDSFSKVVSALADTPYEKEIEECVMGNGGPSGVDEALKRNLTRTFRRVKTYVSKEAEKLVILVLARWDLHNIKTVLRGKHIQASEDEITRSLVPVGELDEILLLELARQPDVNACVDLLATWEIPYARPLTESMADYMEDKNLTLLELALDKYYYTRALKLTKKHSSHSSLVQQLILAEVDISNIITLLRLQNVDFDKVKEDLKHTEKKKIEEDLEGEQEKGLPEEEEAGEEKVDEVLEETQEEAEEDQKEEAQEQAQPEQEEEPLSEEVSEDVERIKEAKRMGEGVVSEEEVEEEVKVSIWAPVKRGLTTLKSNIYRWRKEKKQTKAEEKRTKKQTMKQLAKRSASYVGRGIKTFLTLPERPVWVTRRRRGKSRREKLKITEETISEIDEITKKVVGDYVEDMIVDFYIPGGGVINQKKFYELAQKDDVMDVVDNLRDTEYGPILERLSKRYLETDRVSIIERALEELLVKRAMSMYNVGPLSFGVLLSYIWAKYNEVVNLRIIVRGKSVEMPERDIREELVLSESK